MRRRCQAHRASTQCELIDFQTAFLFLLFLCQLVSALSGLNGTCSYSLRFPCAMARFCYDGACTPSFVPCVASSTGARCVDRAGNVGRCRSDTLCALDDKPCAADAQDGDECVLDSRPGSCFTDNAYVEQLCARHLGDQAAYDLCATTVPAGKTCDVNVFCPNPEENGLCYTSGRGGKCRQMCTDYSAENSKKQTLCPRPASGVFFTLAEATAVCAMSFSPSCVSELSACRVGINDEYRTSCVIDTIAQLYPYDTCFRNDTVCANEGDFCVEENRGGLCLPRPTNITELYCHDDSDRCPLDARCNVETYRAVPANETVTIEGKCNSDFFCEALYIGCEAEGSVCWQSGLRGRCDDQLTCLLDDTPACAVDRLSAVCTASGLEGQCGYPFEVLTHHCPSYSRCIYIGDFVFCPDMFPPPTPFPTKGLKRQVTRPWQTPSWTPPWTPLPTVSEETCLETVRIADEPVRCLVDVPCYSGTARNNTCFIDGFRGRCQSDCFAFNGVSSQVTPFDCTFASDSVPPAEVTAVVTRMCKARGDTSQQCVTSAEQLVQVSCQTGEGSFKASCVLGSLGVGYSTSCRRDDTGCARSGGFCIENNLPGKCTSANGKLECRELSDDCPVGSACAVPYVTSLPSFSGIPTTENRTGVCDARFNCVLRQEPCDGTTKGQCFEVGKVGACVSRSVAQEQQLSKCVAESRDPKSCYLRYTTCFVGCRYPSQICGPSNVCAFVDQSDSLKCTKIDGEPPKVAEVNGGIVLIQVESPTIFDSKVQSAVQQVLAENKLAGLPFIPQDRTIGFVVLSEIGSISKAQYDALEVAVASLRLSNGISNAFVVLGKGSEKPQPDELCGTRKCSKAAVCRGDTTCVRVVDRGVCEELVGGGLECVCDKGWSGELCGESSAASGETRLSQWVFSKVETPDIDAKRARALVADAFDAIVDSLDWQLVVTETDSYVTVRVLTPVDQKLFTQRQIDDVRAAHALLQKTKGVNTGLVYFPVPIPPATSKSASSTLQLASLAMVVATLTLTDH